MLLWSNLHIPSRRRICLATVLYAEEREKEKERKGKKNKAGKDNVI